MIQALSRYVWLIGLIEHLQDQPNEGFTLLSEPSRVRRHLVVQVRVWTVEHHTFVRNVGVGRQTDCAPSQVAAPVVLYTNAGWWIARKAVKRIARSTRLGNVAGRTRLPLRTPARHKSTGNEAGTRLLSKTRFKIRHHSRS